MADVARYELADGSVVSVEVEPGQGYDPAGAVDRIAGTLQHAVRPAVLAARTVLTALEEARPDEAEVTFSIKATGDADWIVAKASAEGTLQVKLLWRKAAHPADVPPGPAVG